MTAGFHYQPGSAVAVVHQQIAVLLAADPADPVVDRVADLVLAGAGVDDVLDALVVSGLKSLVDFGAFEVRADGVRLVVRGQVSGSVGAQERLVAERTMWHDTWQPGQGAAGLAVPTATGPSLPLRSGVVLAASVHYGTPAVVARDAAELAAQPLTKPAAEVVDAVAPVTSKDKNKPVVALEPVVAAADPQPEPVTEPVSEPDAEAGPNVDFAHLFGATLQAPVVLPDEPAEADSEAEPEAVPSADQPEAVVQDPSATMATPLTIPPESLPGRSPGGTSAAAEPASPSAPAAAPASGGLITGMPWLAGAGTPATAAAPVEVPRPAPAAAAAPVAPVAAPAPAPVAPVATSAPAPVRAEPVANPAPGLVTPTEGAADRTINRASLVGRSPVVTVTAIRCAQGHANPPYAGKCRVCAGPMPPQQPTEIPRPTLGQLRLSTGGLVPLDRPAFLGRNPQVPAGYSAEQPNLVRLPDPDKDVSGQHLEVSLDYWNVLVRDLGSTNGTEVILPGEMPVVLRANDPVIIEPGTRVVLAGTISFIFEVTA